MADKNELNLKFPRYFFLLWKTHKSVVKCVRSFFSKKKKRKTSWLLTNRLLIWNPASVDMFIVWVIFSELDLHCLLIGADSDKEDRDFEARRNFKPRICEYKISRVVRSADKSLTLNSQIPGNIDFESWDQLSKNEGSLFLCYFKLGTLLCHFRSQLFSLVQMATIWSLKVRPQLCGVKVENVAGFFSSN